MNQNRPVEYAELLREALSVIEELQERLRRAEEGGRTPIAITGMACRFPGANDPEAFWELLREGRITAGEIPEDRWDADAYYDADPARPWHMVTRQGNFLDDVWGIDSDFFRMSPREAVQTDPQQRLLLEVAWEALEDAGLDVDRLAGGRTGVFTGIMAQDYALRWLAGQAADGPATHYATGNDLAFASGRLSYLLRSHGPSLSVSTACSSSLVALHLACRSLRDGECDLAIVGGVNLILSPVNSIALSRARALSPDGRCKPFDARADGFGRGEGCGVVVLRRLPEALADGDHIHAVLRGSAVNHDGPSGGVTVPSGPAQQALIQAALRDAGLKPDALDYIEAHGTGTALGDPIELHALGEVLAERSSGLAPVVIASVKANVGHLEAAAGMAGLFKVLLALRQECIPAQPDLQRLNPHVAWGRLPLRVAGEPVPWWRGARPRVAGVSSFGMAGTNAHVIVAEPPHPEIDASPPASPPGGWQIVPISARSPAALAALTQRFVAMIDRSSPDVAALARAAACRRPHYPLRRAYVVQSIAELREGLAAGNVSAAAGGWSMPMAEDAIDWPSFSSRLLAADDGEREALLRRLAAQYEVGGNIDWQAVYPGVALHVALPSYPWQRQPARPDGNPYSAETPAAATQANSASVTAGVDVSPSLLAALRAEPAARRRPLLQERLIMLLADVLGRPAAGLRSESQRGLQDLGMDSILAVELLRRIGAEVGRSYNAAVVFEYPNVPALAGFLLDDLDLALSSAAPLDQGDGEDGTDPLLLLERELGIGPGAGSGQRRWSAGGGG